MLQVEETNLWWSSVGCSSTETPYLIQSNTKFHCPNHRSSCSDRILNIKKTFAFCLFQKILDGEAEISKK